MTTVHAPTPAAGPGTTLTSRMHCTAHRRACGCALSRRCFLNTVVSAPQHQGDHMLTPRPGNSLGAWRAAHVFLPSHAPRPRLPTSPDQSTLCVRCIHVVGLQQQRRAPRHPRSAVSSPSARLSARHLVEPSGCTLLGAALLADATVARACAAPTKLPLRPHASAPRHELGRCHLGTCHHPSVPSGGA